MKKQTSPPILEQSPLGKRETDIINSAIGLFQEKGFEATTTKEIASGAGIAEGTVFRYFKTKKDILLKIAAASMIKAAAPHIFKPVEEMMAQHEKTVAEILKEVVKNRVELISKNFGIAKILISEAQYHPELRQAWIDEIPLQGIKIITAFLQERVKTGELRKDINPHDAVLVLAGMTAALVINHNIFARTEEDKKISDQEIDNIINIFISGMKAGELNEAR